MTNFADKKPDEKLGDFFTQFWRFYSSNPQNPSKVYIQDGYDNYHRIHHYMSGLALVGTSLFSVIIGGFFLKNKNILFWSQFANDIGIKLIEDDSNDMKNAREKYFNKSN